MPRRKRDDAIERERDIAFILRLRFRKVPAGEIVRRLNERRTKEAYEAAIGAGIPEAEARVIALEAQISGRMVKKDFALAKRRIQADSRLTGQALLLERLDELELERQTLMEAERQAWEQFDRSAGPATLQIERRDAVETPALGPGGAPMIGAGGEPVVRRGTKPRNAEQRRQERPAADPRWLAVIESLVWKRVLIGQKMFELRAMLGLESPWELVQLARGGDGKAAEALGAHEVGLLYSLEARAAGLDPATSRGRLQVLSQAIAAKRPAGNGDFSGALIFEVIGLNVETE